MVIFLLINLLLITLIIWRCYQKSETRLISSAVVVLNKDEILYFKDDITKSIHVTNMNPGKTYFLHSHGDLNQCLLDHRTVLLNPIMSDLVMSDLVGRCVSTSDQNCAIIGHRQI